MKDIPALPTALQTVLGPRPTRRAVRRVVYQCHRMACAYLRKQQQTGALREDLLGEDVEDLAMDAVAGLFERDDDGRFPELRRYFEDRSFNASDGAAVEQELRRLVLSTVTDWLFEAYRTADRSLSNLIRNLKRVLGAREDVRLRRRGREMWVESCPEAQEEGTGAAREQGRRMPMEALEAYLTGAVAENPSTGELAGVAIEALRRHPDYEAAYPLTRLAQVMRAARTRVQAVTEHATPVSLPEAPLLRPEEVEEVLEQSLVDLREEKKDTYVEAGKVDSQTYRSYFQALYDRFESRFVTTGEEQTHYDALSTYLEGLSHEQYREQHRSRFEYLARCARQILVERLRELV